ncbi:1,4-dihydroxy-2-naphthoate octaprenyltransferase [Altibacter sp. HG106]|uniref:1,4-dihydroxy-2-naphthoate octaprenyltransferase n=1 Tax=Altibacter sp. HG106 TaxID=3023937 RepID=UPI0023506049|nr:1,4-dihydroxy-2-naphthoate octaprenyltransferase [Altibacter sp. HG106]MDC7993925.1 1,4-dihydroxy-2-naphthoate octaprenyltransferase [Altibacter sp. HG106]
MASPNAWLAAARLRTLPLSISGILVGSSLAAPHFFYRSTIFWLAILTTIGFQVLSNFANDYGDGIKGTDTQREGEQRMVAAGIISAAQMKRGMIAIGIVTLTIALLLIYEAFGDQWGYALLFFGLGIASIIAAVTYTVGRNAYGYKALGDVFVFLFFGMLSVLGSYFLFIKQFVLLMILPACSIGFLSMAVLNLNNMRDRVADAAVGKITLAVKLGAKGAKQYHTVLIIDALAAYLLFVYETGFGLLRLLPVLAFLPLFLNVRTVWKNEAPALLDPELKKVALSTFAFAILIMITTILTA